MNRTTLILLLIALISKLCWAGSYVDVFFQIASAATQPFSDVTVTVYQSGFLTPITMSVCSSSPYWYYARVPNPGGVQGDSFDFQWNNGAYTYYDQGYGIQTSSSGLCQSQSTAGLYPVDFTNVNVNYYVTHGSGASSIYPCLQGTFSTSSVPNYYNAALGCNVPTPNPTPTAAATQPVVVATPTPTEFVTLYYKNDKWYADSSVTQVQIWLYTSSGNQIGTFNLAKCFTTNFWFGTINLIQSSQVLLPVALGSSGSPIYYDNSGCSANQNYQGFTYSLMGTVNELDSSNSQGCGGAVVTSFTGQANISCSPPQTSYTTFYYYNPGWWNSASVNSVGLDMVTPGYVIVLNKCSTNGYYYSLLGAYQPQSSLTFLPVGYSYNDGPSPTCYDHYSSSSNNYLGLIDFTKNNTLMSTTTNADCTFNSGDTFMTNIDPSGFGCPTLPFTNITYRNPVWANYANIEFVQLKVFTADLKNTFIANMIKIGPQCWSAVVQAANPSASQQRVIVVASNGNGNTVSVDYSDCQSSNYVVNFTNPYNFINSNVGCNGTVLSGPTFVGCSSTPTSTPTSTPPSNSAGSPTPTNSQIELFYRNPVSYAQVLTGSSAYVLLFSLSTRRRSLTLVANLTLSQCVTADLSSMFVVFVPSLSSNLSAQIAVYNSPQLISLDSPSCNPSQYFPLDFTQTQILIQSSGCLPGPNLPSFTDNINVHCALAPTPTPTPSPTSSSSPTISSSTSPTTSSSSSAMGTPSAAAAVANGLSTADKNIIIGVLVAVGSVILIVLVVFCCRQSRRKPISDDPVEQQGSGVMLVQTDNETRVISSYYPPTLAEKNAQLQMVIENSPEVTINSTLMNTLTEIAIPGYLHMSIDQLRMMDKIGSGGNGLIQRAQVVDPTWKRENPKYTEVAVKFVPENKSGNPNENRATFQQEVAIMNALRYHSNIITLLGFCENPQFIVTPICKGDLCAYLHFEDAFAKRPAAEWTPVAMLDIANQMASALFTMHGMHIIHRDIKTKNVLFEVAKPELSLSGLPYQSRLIDFGISRIVQNEKNQEVKFFPAVNVFGLSTRYASPETFSHLNMSVSGKAADADTEKKSDVYAFGICLWEMLTQSVPWDGLTGEQINRKVIDGERPEIPPSPYPPQSLEGQLTRELVKIIQSCWQQLPSNRPDMREVSSTLQQLTLPLKRASMERLKENRSSPATTPDNSTSQSGTASV